ncbi:MAG: DUF1697 domain-containing protein [Gemmatimonadaceae bacterium]|nr:DUF1697 domain-containing protein [Gemmatimonadaceae bacterium]
MSRTHVALLRGINVGKAKRIAMSDLKRVVESVGCTDVRTLLNSGNVAFTTRRKISGDSLRKAILADTGVDARTIVLTASDVDTIMRENPLTGIATDPTRLVVYVPVDGVHLAKMAELQARDWSPEVMAVGSRAAYVWSPDGLLNGQLFELVGKHVKDAVTARNWATMTKLQALLAST